MSQMQLSDCVFSQLFVYKFCSLIFKLLKLLLLTLTQRLTFSLFLICLCLSSSPFFPPTSSNSCVWCLYSRSTSEKFPTQEQCWSGHFCLTCCRDCSFFFSGDTFWHSTMGSQMLCFSHEDSWIMSKNSSQSHRTINASARN